jgi:uncharacterized membrane protein
MLTPIIILTLLSCPLAIAFIYSKINKSQLNITKYASWGLGASFIFFFIGHIVKAEAMVEMLPTWVPFRLTLIYVTGLLELAVGIALFLPKYQITAAKFAIVIFVLFFPANIYAALNSIGLGGHQWGPVYLAVRGPLQLILVAWSYFFCIKGYVKKFSE